jgi:hypothetical protein
MKGNSSCWKAVIASKLKILSGRLVEKEEKPQP